MAEIGDQKEKFRAVMESSFCKCKTLFQCVGSLLCEIFADRGRTAQCFTEDIDDFLRGVESFFSCFSQAFLEDTSSFFGFICLAAVKKLVLLADL